MRPTIAYGPGQAPDMFLPALLRSLVDGNPFAMTHGEQTRDFLHIDDLVRGILRASTAPDAGNLIVNLGSGKSIPIRQAAEIAMAVTGTQDLLLLGSTQLRIGEAVSYAVDLSRAREVLGWEARVPLEIGLLEMARDLRM